MSINEIKAEAEVKGEQVKTFLRDDLEQTKKDVADIEKKAYEEKGIVEEKLHHITKK